MVSLVKLCINNVLANEVWFTVLENDNEMECTIKYMFCRIPVFKIAYYFIQVENEFIDLGKKNDCDLQGKTKNFLWLQVQNLIMMYTEVRKRKFKMDEERTLSFS